MILLSSALSGHSWDTTPVLPVQTSPGQLEIRTELAEIGTLGLSSSGRDDFNHSSVLEVCVESPQQAGQKGGRICSVVLSFWHGIKPPWNQSHSCGTQTLLEGAGKDPTQEGPGAAPWPWAHAGVCGLAQELTRWKCLPAMWPCLFICRFDYINVPV